jgi:beta-mannanase
MKYIGRRDRVRSVLLAAPVVLAVLLSSHGATFAAATSGPKGARLKFTPTQTVTSTQLTATVTATQSPPTATATAAQATPTATATANQSTPTATATQPTPTSTPSSANVIGLGVYRPEFPNNLSVASSLENASSKKLPIIAWYALWGGWKSAFSASDLDAVSARGSMALITWEPWSGVSSDPAWTLRNAILSGSNDAYIDSWARGMAAFHQPVFLRFAHEMHNQTYPWAVGINGNTAADYVAAWKHVHDIFARYDTSNVKWIWNPNTLGDAPASTYLPIYQSLYPGDAYVDWLGLDIYNTGPNLNWGAPYWRSFSQVLTEPYKAITAMSHKRLMLPEVASAETGGSKAAWITDMMQTQLPSVFPAVRALVWFDVKKEENWPLDSSSMALDAWTTSSRDAAYTPNPGALLGSPN